MTIIEIYDKEHPIYNIMAQALYPAAEFVYLGAKNALSRKARQRLINYYTARKSGRLPEFLVVDEESVDSIEEALQPFMSEDDCYIELRGGTEVMFVALGALAEHHHLSMFQINPNTAKIKLIIGHLPEQTPQEPDLKYGELLCLTGGCISSESEDLTTAAGPATKDAVTRMWGMYQEDSGRYNAKNSRLARIINPHVPDDAENSVDINADAIRTIRDDDFDWAVGYIRQLARKGLLHYSELDKNGIVFDYKNSICRELIEKSGLLLELFGRIAARESGRFSDVRQGVRLDWDGKLTENQTVDGTSNEVDLILVDGFAVYYVSCKSGHFEKEALYELETVASKFDTGNVKMVLICDEIDDPVRERAHDMHIQVIDDVTQYNTIEELSKKLEKMA